MKYILIEYPKCSTCKKAKKHLEEKKIDFIDRDIVKCNPKYEELKQWYETYKVPIKKYFNTSGILYKEMQLKDKLLTMTDDEKLKLLSSNGMLVKRPILLCDSSIIIGYKKEMYDAL